jgi:hypothetical protein
MVVVVVVSLLIIGDIPLKSQNSITTGSDTLTQLHPITTFVFGI